MEFTKILFLSETYRRPIRDQHENRRPLGGLDMLHRRLIGDRHAPSETDMPDRRPNGDLDMLSTIKTSTC